MADDGAVKIQRELTSSEMNRLSLALSSTTLSDEAKRIRETGLVAGIVATGQVSQNSEQGMERSQGQQNQQYGAIQVLPAIWLAYELIRSPVYDE